jgi:hypothetical protein
MLGEKKLNKDMVVSYFSILGVRRHKTTLDQT